MYEVLTTATKYVWSFTSIKYRLYSVPYQHFTNSIENYFSMIKSRLNKLDNLTHKELKTNIEKVIKDIPKEKYENIIKGTYNRTKKYSKKPSNRRKTLKNYL